MNKWQMKVSYLTIKCRNIFWTCYSKQKTMKLLFSIHIPTQLLHEISLSIIHITVFYSFTINLINDFLKKKYMETSSKPIYFLFAIKFSPTFLNWTKTLSHAPKFLFSQKHSRQNDSSHLMHKYISISFYNRWHKTSHSQLYFSTQRQKIFFFPWTNCISYYFHAAYINRKSAETTFKANFSVFEKINMHSMRENKIYTL